MQIKALYFAVEPFIFQFIFHKNNLNHLTYSKVSSIYVRSAEQAAGHSISPISHDQNSTDFIKIVVNCFIFAARPEKRKSGGRSAIIDQQHLTMRNSFGINNQDKSFCH